MRKPRQEVLFQFTYHGWPHSWKMIATEQHFHTPDKLTEGEKRAVGIRI